MKINIQFINGTASWRNLITANADKASQILSDPLFIECVRAWKGFDFTDESPEQVASKLEKTDVVTIRVGFYCKLFTKAIAYEQDGAIYFNTRKASYGAGSVGNLVHEVMHALGYRHNGNSPSGNQNTVPYQLGKWASDWKVKPAAAVDVASLVETAEAPA